MIGKVCEQLSFFHVKPFIFLTVIMFVVMLCSYSQTGSSGFNHSFNFLLSLAYFIFENCVNEESSFIFAEILLALIALCKLIFNLTNVCG